MDTLAAHGIYSIIDLHAAPGFQNHHWHSDNPTHWPLFWEYADFTERASWLWEVLADHYLGNGWVAGFNLLSEPADEEGDRLIRWYAETARRVRDVDPDRMLFLDAPVPMGRAEVGRAARSSHPDLRSADTGIRRTVSWNHPR